MTIAAIKRQRGTTSAQVVQRVGMRTDKVADMDVIADTGTVRRSSRDELGRRGGSATSSAI